MLTMAKAPKIPPRSSTAPAAPTRAGIADDRLLGDIRHLIETAREQVARAVNSALVGLYWHIVKQVPRVAASRLRAGARSDRVCAVVVRIDPTPATGPSYPLVSLRGWFHSTTPASVSSVVASFPAGAALSPGTSAAVAGRCWACSATVCSITGQKLVLRRVARPTGEQNRILDALNQELPERLSTDRLL